MNYLINLLRPEIKSDIAILYTLSDFSFILCVELINSQTLACLLLVNDIALNQILKYLLDIILQSKFLSPYVLHQQTSDIFKSCRESHRILLGKIADHEQHINNPCSQFHIFRVLLSYRISVLDSLQANSGKRVPEHMFIELVKRDEVTHLFVP